MSIIEMLIVGGIIGWLAARLMGRHEGAIASVIIGIIGAFIGNWIAQLAGSGASYLSLTWSSFFWSLLGAIVLVAIMNAFQHRTHHNV